MFSIPQPPQPAKSDITLPVVQITESAGVFETFLRLIYPIEPPTVNSLQVVDLLQVAEKYTATGIHAKLRRFLVSSSFLKADPVLVYAIACRADLDKEARLAIPHTFGIDLVQDVPRDKLRMMTVESYHRLLAEHLLRRNQLLNAVDEVYKSRERWARACPCAKQLTLQISLQISNKPLLDREILEELLQNLSEQASSLLCGTGCPSTPGKGPGFISDFMRKVHEI